MANFCAHSQAHVIPPCGTLQDKGSLKKLLASCRLQDREIFGEYMSINFRFATMDLFSCRLEYIVTRPESIVSYLDDN